MVAKQFIEETIFTMSESSIGTLKTRLIGPYLSCSFLDDNDISTTILAEKLCDYFEKVELNMDDDFDKAISKYMSYWDDLVDARIPKEPQAKKGSPAPEMPRPRKYYNLAIEHKNAENMTMTDIVDFSRIMMCLQTAVLQLSGNDKSETISDFDFSTKGFDLDAILASLKESLAEDKKPPIVPGFLKKVINPSQSGIYTFNTCTEIITVMMYAFITDAEMGE